MIEFNYLTDFRLENESRIKNWILKIIKSEDREEGEIVYIFCDDMFARTLFQEVVVPRLSFQEGVSKDVLQEGFSPQGGFFPNMFV